MFQNSKLHIALFLFSIAHKQEKNNVFKTKSMVCWRIVVFYITQINLLTIINWKCLAFYIKFYSKCPPFVVGISFLAIFKLSVAYYPYACNARCLLWWYKFELQHTIKNYYGNDFNACLYLDRFFDLRVTLPTANKNLIYSHLNFKVGSLLYYDKVIKMVVERYSFSIREITKYLNICNIAVNYQTRNNQNIWNDYLIAFIINFILPIALGLKIYNENLYKHFIEGKKGLLL